MSLLTSISGNNRVVEQGNTYDFIVEPAVTTSGIAVEPSGGGVKYYDKTTVQQWRGELHFSKRYRYVGLSKSVAEASAETILNAYTVTANKWAVVLRTFIENNKTRLIYCYVEVGNGAPMTCATATPVQADGNMWNVEVDVSATFEYYTEPSLDNTPTPPSASTLKGLAASIANFPEGG